MKKLVLLLLFTPLLSFSQTPIRYYEGGGVVGDIVGAIIFIVIFSYFFFYYKHEE